MSYDSKKQEINNVEPVEEEQRHPVETVQPSAGCWRKNVSVSNHFLQFSDLSVCQRALEPPDVHHERLLPVSVAGLLVNLVGIFVFQHGGHGHSHGDGGSPAGDETNPPPS